MTPKRNFSQLHLAVQKYILESVTRAGKAGRGESKRRGDAKYYADLAKRRKMKRIIERAIKEGWTEDTSPETEHLPYPPWRSPDGMRIVPEDELEDNLTGD